MKNMSPKKILRKEPNMLYCEWDDRFSSTISLEKLRAECPCADCRKDELAKKPAFNMLKLNQFKSGMNELKKLTPIGNYAITAVWGDGHDTGIYPWDLWREIFEKYKIEENE
jgi:DUF971 family protein